jgi:hypothetical protein
MMMETTLISKLMCFMELGHFQQRKYGVDIMWLGAFELMNQ